MNIRDAYHQGWEDSEKNVNIARCPFEDKELATWWHYGYNDQTMLERDECYGAAQ